MRPTRRGVANSGFLVTGYHRHVGTISDTRLDPDLVGTSWTLQESFARPKQAILTSMLDSFTAVRSAKLEEDFKYLCDGTGKANQCAAVFERYRRKYIELRDTIRERNKAREAPYLQMSPGYAATSVAVCSRTAFGM